MNGFQRYLLAGTSLMSLVFSAASASAQDVFFNNGVPSFVERKSVGDNLTAGGVTVGLRYQM